MGVAALSFVSASHDRNRNHDKELRTYAASIREVLTAHEHNRWAPGYIEGTPGGDFERVEAEINDDSQIYAGDEADGGAGGFHRY